MTKIFQIPQLPTALSSVDGDGKRLQEIEGRSIITQKTGVLVGDIHKDGYTQRYTHTLPELSLLVEQFQSRKQLERISLYQTKVLTTKYTLFQKLLEDTQEEINSTVKDFYSQHKSQLDEVIQYLQDMIDGKTPPKGTELSAVQAAVQRQTQELKELRQELQDIITLRAGN